MNFTTELIEIVKIKQGLVSDYAVAKMINVSPQMLSNWKNGKSEANAENAIKLMAAGEVTANDALAIVTKKSISAGGALSKTALLCILCKIQFKLINRLIQMSINPTTCRIINFA